MSHDPGDEDDGVEARFRRYHIRGHTWSSVILALLDADPRPYSPSELIATLNMSPNTLYKTLQRLVKRNMIKHDLWGRYSRLS